MLKPNIKELYSGNRPFPYARLYFHKIPLNKLIKSFREIDIFDKKEKKRENEIFLTIKEEPQNRYFYVTLTDDFKEWCDKNTFTKPYSIQIIQQQDNPNEYLIVVEESQILGHILIDYKTKEEIEEFFNR